MIANLTNTEILHSNGGSCRCVYAGTVTSEPPLFINSEVQCRNACCTQGDLMSYTAFMYSVEWNGQDR